MCHFFSRKYFTLNSCTYSTGATGMGSPAAGLAAGLAATGWQHAWRVWHEVWQLWGRHGSRFGRGLQPLWHAVCLRNIAGNIQFSVGKNICQTPYTTSTLCPYNLSVGRTVTVFLNTIWGSLSTDVSDDTSESVAVCEAWDDSPDPDPEVPSPPLAQTRARFWFQDQKCGNTGSPCLDKPVLARGTYYGTQVAGIAQP